MTWKSRNIASISSSRSVATSGSSAQESFVPKKSTAITPPRGSASTSFAHTSGSASGPSRPRV